MSTTCIVRIEKVVLSNNYIVLASREPYSLQFLMNTKNDLLVNSGTAPLQHPRFEVTTYVFNYIIFVSTIAAPPPLPPLRGEDPFPLYFAFISHNPGQGHRKLTWNDGSLGQPPTV